MNNSCGTTSFSAILTDFGIPGDFRLIDKSVRFHWGAGGATSPMDDTAYMRRAGLQAYQYSHCDFSDIEENFRAGRAIQVLIDYSPADGGAHYVDVIGIVRDPQTHEPTGVQIYNPWGDVETPRLCPTLIEIMEARRCEQSRLDGLHHQSRPAAR